MARLRTDVAVNLLGQGWAAAISLLFVPLFVARLGIEGYAVIALLPLCTSLIQVLDCGLALTLNREMARVSAIGTPTATRSAAWTLQAVHLSVGTLLGVATIALLPAVGLAWLQQPSLPRAAFREALVVLAIAVAVHWPIPLFQNGLMGLGRQSRVNGLIAINATILNVGAAAIITLWSPNPAAFLLWAAACALMHAIALALVFWRALPPARVRPKFEPDYLRSVLRFSGGAAGIGVTGVILTHLDRLVASRLLSLEQFGYYGLAVTIGRSVYLLIAPVFSAAFPRLSALIARKDYAGLSVVYSSATQVMCVAIFPLTAVVLWMGFDLAQAWLGDARTARAVSDIAAALAIGAAINGVMHMPYGLQLASGLTRLGLQINLALVAMSIPAAVFLCKQFGALGLALTWPLINAVYFLVGVPLTHRAVGFGRALPWFVGDVAPTVLVSFATVGAVHSVLGVGSTRLASTAAVLAGLVLGYAAAALAADRFRSQLLLWMRGRAVK